MSEGLVPQQPAADSVALRSMDGLEQHPGLPPAQHPLDRPLAALRRFKWLMLAVFLLSIVAGYIAARMTERKYEAKATLWIDSRSGGSGRGKSGPLEGADLLTTSQYVELFKSYKVVDQVVRRLGLFVRPTDPADAPLFASFAVEDNFRTGPYALRIDKTRKTWALQAGQGGIIDRGAASDSIGRKLGFRWQLPAAAFEGSGEKTVKFGVTPPREGSVKLLKSLVAKMSQGSNFVWLTFTDKRSKGSAQTLNTWVSVFIEVASDLKKRNDVEVAHLLSEQLRFAEKATQDAETAYQSFRVRTITLPTESAPLASGINDTRQQVMQSYFQQKIAFDNLRQDREAIERSLAAAAKGEAPYEAILLIPSVSQVASAEGLRDAFKSLTATQARLRVERQTYTDEYPLVKELKASVEALEKQTIPQLAARLIVELRQRETDFQRRIDGQSRELAEIPARTIEEMRLNRGVQVASGLYANLKNRHAETQLAAVSAVPDVSVLDTAIAPLMPTSTTASKMFLAALGGGLGAAIGLALLLDMIDKRIRYTSQATNDLGLSIAGAIPRVPKGGINASSPEQVSQFVEAFRSLRMHVMYGVSGTPVVLAVTSAAPRDGKSLISGNLALSFAEAGLRTVLVDGDTRRGSLHKMFDLKMPGGLTDYLDGSLGEENVVRSTAYRNLSFVSCGRRNTRSPELLTSPRLKSFVEHLSKSYDVVIFDTPPLAAGIDGYALCAAAGNVVMVLRMGETEKRLASTKLAMLDRLPVGVVGAVLNDVPQTGEFQYYTYSPAYAIDRDDSNAELAITGAK